MSGHAAGILLLALTPPFLALTIWHYVGYFTGRWSG